MKFNLTIIFERKGWLLWSCLFYFLAVEAACGQVVAKDKAKIKGAGVVWGQVLKYDQPGEFVFLSSRGDTLQVPSDEVIYSRISNAVKVPKAGSFWHSAELGMNWGRRNSGQRLVPSLHIESAHAYVFRQLVQPGAGVGYQMLEDLHIVPVFASLSGDLLKRRLSPFYTFNAGYGFAWEQTSRWTPQRYREVTGGFLWQLGGGVRIASRKYATLLKLGYRKQQVELDESLWWTDAGGRSITRRTFRKLYTGIAWIF